MSDHARLMAAALALGDRGRGTTWPNPSVGALVVRVEDARPVVVGRGWTKPGGRPHAETEALKAAGDAARGATLYVSLEPCAHFGKTPPCADAIVAAGIARVVASIDDPDPRTAGAGFAKLRAAGIEVLTGVLAQEARRSHAGHIRRIRDGRPHVLLKVAASADGKVGLPGPRPAAITGEPARARVHMMRAMSDAIMIGIGTALADDPDLTCRLPGLFARSPVRVVLDRELRLPASSRLATTATRVPVWVVAGEGASADAEARLVAAGVEVMRVAAGQGPGVDPLAALRLLAARGITRLMVEGGPTVTRGLVEADLVDEIGIWASPVVIGPDAPAMPAMLSQDAMAVSKMFEPVSRESVGVDTLTLYRRR